MKKLVYIIIFLLTTITWSQNDTIQIPEIFTSVQKGSWSVTLDGVIVKDGFTRIDKANSFALNLKLAYPNGVVRTNPPALESDINIKKLKDFLNFVEKPIDSIIEPPIEPIDSTDTKPIDTISITGQLYDFRVDKSNKVYFKSKAPIYSTDTDKYFISGKTVQSLIIDADSLGGYFTTVEGFSFWDNNTIRYEGQSEVEPFTLQYIDNLIPEPVSSVFRYVTVNGGGNRDGTSEANAWTLQEAKNNAEGGMTVWVKSGNYGAQQLLLDGIDTSEDNPVKFIGYKETPGDITSMYYKYTYPEANHDPMDKPLDASEMPLLTNESRTLTGAPIRIRNSFVIIRNFQVREGQFNFEVNGGREGVIFDNCLSMIAIGIKSGFQTQQSAKRIRIINSVSVNAEMAGIYPAGNHNLIENNKVYSDGIRGSDGSDYYLFLNGDHNIMRNNYAERAYPDGHGGHGIGLKSQPTTRSVTYNLIENFEVVGSLTGMELRHDDVMYNVIRNGRFTRGRMPSNTGQDGKGYAGGLTIRDNASYNHLENLYFGEGLRMGINFRDNSEEGDQPSGRFNTGKNLIFEGLPVVFKISPGSQAWVEGNVFTNCTFVNNLSIYNGTMSKIIEGNLLQWSIFVDNNRRVEDYTGSIERYGFDETNNVYFNNGYGIHNGTGNISVDPVLDENFIPQNESVKQYGAKNN